MANAPRKDQLVVRFTRVELIQHWVLLVSLLGLALTGLALFAHATPLGRWLIELEGGMEARGLWHRVFAVLLIGLTVWHLLYVLFSPRGNEQLRAMVPTRQDLRDLASLIRYYRGVQGEPPEFGRFSPLQKLQYWGAGVGSLIMIFTGFILWFHTEAMMVLPKWLFDVTAVVHGYEGLLLFIVLFVWHVYMVHLSPGHFPWSRVFLTGKITAEELWRHHRAEYRALFGDEPPLEE
ncbi:MAG: cytochrome b/b6 domain-containing protein [Thermoanaerobaculum sp.]|nr:cytochrome b/b6 domain-containing protein [Thermoanaerobaculum sp.]MDW7967135.1 cytochrome b/b6 domain-containing protein [Thermoanaerobaculum sp.]